MKKVGLLALFILFATGCERDIDFKAMEDKSAEDIFSLGKKEKDAKHYSDAVKVFEELERLHPYSKLTAEAQLSVGECNYKAKKYSEAISSFEIFVKTHPTHEKVPYAIYMLGLINYEQMPIIERDQEATVEALSYLNELCERYTSSQYTPDAKKKVVELRQQIAGREVYIARYYQSRKNYAAAIGRLNTVIELYKDTIHAPEAMHRLIECYVAMGVLSEAKTIYKILKREYPDSSWVKHATSLLLQTK